MSLESYLRSRLGEKEILLMTHIVLGYPSLDESFKVISAMVQAGVDLMELQIPFSEPTADGPVIAHANQEALDRGITVIQCLDLAERITQTFEIPFLFMTYYNIPFKYGLNRFTSAMSDRDIRGAIIPDLPPEEGKDYLDAMHEYGLAPVLIFTPNTSLERMRYIASFAEGLIYCVARKGVTGKDTDFSAELAAYLARCRKATTLPLAVGFGIKEKTDLDFLKGRADIAVVGTQSIRIMEKDGISAVGEFIRGLR
jgi:tryptophan synthase alpha chain